MSSIDSTCDNNSVDNVLEMSTEITKTLRVPKSH